MPDITITLTAAQLQRFIDASADIYDYAEYTRVGGPNPLTRAQFARARLIEHMKALVRRSETRQAAATASAAVTDLGLVT